MKKLLTFLAFLVLCSPAWATANYTYHRSVTQSKVMVETLASGTYTSGLTPIGTTGQTCLFTAFDGAGTGATASVALTGTNTIAGGTALLITNVGAGYTSAPTTATAAAGTATSCTGTPVLSTALTSLTNFTMLVRFPETGFDANYKSVANGGHIQNSVSHNGQTVPADWTLGDASTAPCGTNYKFDIESWDSTNGAINAWVLVSSFSYAADWTAYACYGDVGTTAYQGGTKGQAWDSYHVAVNLLPDGTTLNPAGYVGSNTDTNTSLTAGTGKVDGGGVSAGSAHLDMTGPNLASTPITLSAWIYPTTISVANYIRSIISYGDGNQNGRDIFALVCTGTASSCSSGHIGIDIKNQSNTELSAVDPTAVSANTWYCTAGVYDGSYMYVYKNGALVASTAFSGTLQTSMKLYAFQMYNFSPTSDFLGNLDTLKVANAARSLAWHATECNNQGSLSSYETLGAEVGGTSKVVRRVIQ